MGGPFQKMDYVSLPVQSSWRNRDLRLSCGELFCLCNHHTSEAMPGLRDSQMNCWNRDHSDAYKGKGEEKETEGNGHSYDFSFVICYKTAPSLSTRTLLEAKRTVCWDRILLTVGLLCVTEEPPFLLMSLTRAGRKASHLTKDPLTHFMTFVRKHFLPWNKSLKSLLCSIMLVMVS